MSWAVKGNLRTFPLMGLQHADRIANKAKRATKILEYGSGGSTLWLGQLAPTALLVSVEHDRNWLQKVEHAYRRLRQAPIGMADFFHVHINGENGYASAGPHPDMLFNLILVDGLHESRTACMGKAFSRLTPGGTVFLHNSEEPIYQDGITAFLNDGGEFVGEYPDPSYNRMPNTMLWEGKKP